MKERAIWILLRGWRKCCPNCGKGALFESWATLAQRCARCGWEIGRQEPNTWFFMYISTAFLTGLIVILMFLVTPPSLLAGRVGVAVLALIVFIGTHSRRKGIAIAVEYLVSRVTSAPKSFPQEGKTDTAEKHDPSADPAARIGVDTEHHDADQ